ncbi:ring finger domain containing protein [Nitzschia inconspicua]|uniref:Ring finger domain containing protein n=1 Tax=Nitzschia inconspicua TaxID=303405 RepID=A0A9K3KB56_9STRA|nr:ring finger domain containing protein [Nitzschia inconspicua]
MMTTNPASAISQIFTNLATTSAFLRGTTTSPASTWSSRFLTDDPDHDNNSTTPSSSMENIITSNVPNSLTTAEMTLWYCLVAAIVIPIMACSLYFVHHNHRSHRRALQAMAENDTNDDDDEDETASSAEFVRMQQNIKAWSELEKQRIARIVRCSVRQNHHLPGDSLQKRSTKDSVCGICLEDLGSKCVGSSNPQCIHLYHEDCIVSWLAPRQHWLCPICRQVFLLNPSRKALAATAATTMSSDSTLSDAFSILTDTCPSTTTADHLSTTAFPATDQDVDVVDDDNNNNVFLAHSESSVVNASRAVCTSSNHHQDGTVVEEDADSQQKGSAAGTTTSSIVICDDEDGEDAATTIASYSSTEKT